MKTNTARKRAATTENESMPEATNLLKTFKVRDGRSIGDVQFHELENLAAQNEREAKIIRYLIGHVANAAPDPAVTACALAIGEARRLEALDRDLTDSEVIACDLLQSKASVTLATSLFGVASLCDMPLEIEGELLDPAVRMLFETIWQSIENIMRNGYAIGAYQSQSAD